MLNHPVISFLVPALAAGVLVVSCGGATPQPTLRPNVVAPTQASSGPTSGYTEKVNLDEFSPPGPGRDLLIMNCDSCHPWVCALRGQRTLDHWHMVEDVHTRMSTFRGSELIPLSSQDWNTLFSYLEKNFSDQQPEPNLPPAFQQAGCTTPD